MRKQQKTINQTFSLPVCISQELHTYVKRREMVVFQKELEAKKEELRQAYLSANKDEGQLEAMDDWQSTLGDGLNEW